MAKMRSKQNKKKATGKGNAQKSKMQALRDAKLGKTNDGDVKPTHFDITIF